MRRARTLLTGSVVALAAGTVAIAALLWSQQASPAAAPSTTPPVTAEVIRGSLRDTKTVTGTLGYGKLSALRPILAAASAMVTWIAPVGSTIERGEPLYGLDGQPAILFYGSIPQYRTLRFEAGTETPIWVEFETAKHAAEAANLKLRLEQERLRDAEARSAAAYARLDDARSITPAMPEFIQLQGAMRAAEAKLGRVTELSEAELAPTVDIAAAEAELASARAIVDAVIRALSKDLSAAKLDAAVARTAIAEAEMKRDELGRAVEALVARSSDNTDVAQLAENLAALGYKGTLGEQVRAWQHAAGLAITGIVGPSQMVIAEGPAHIAAHSASVGETLIETSPERGAILDYSSTQKLVTVALAVGDQGLAAVGRAVAVTLPDDSKVDGAISEVGSVVSDGAITVTVAIADQAALDGLEIASVDVEFVSDNRDDVLSVPVAALLARPEGGFALEVVTGGASALIPVDTGLFASGRVEVAGDGIVEGIQVGVPG